MSSPETKILHQLPTDIFNTKEMFLEVLKESWSQLSKEKRDQMMRKFMPSEDVLPNPAREETIDLLLGGGELGMFELDPINNIYFNLKISRLAPDIKQALNDVKTLTLKAQQLREKEYQTKIWSKIMNRRKSVFKSSLNIACDEPVKSCPELTNEDWRAECSLILSKRDSKRIKKSVDERYMNELRKLTDESDVNFLSSSDEEDVNLRLIEKKSLKTSDEKRLIRMVKSLKRKRKTKETLDEAVSNITLKDVIARVEGTLPDEVYFGFPSVPIAIKPKVRRKSKATPVPSKPLPPSQTVSSVSGPIKGTMSAVHELSEKLRDSMGAAILARKMEMNLNKKASESADVFDFDDDSPSESLSLKGRTPSGTTQVTNSVASVPIPSIPSFSKSPPSVPVVYEDPPSSFFSLIRNVFQEHAPNDHKLTLHKLEELVKEKLKTLDPKIGWSHESVQSAMNFLSYYSETPPKGATPTIESQDSSSSFPGTEMVPLVDYKEKNQQWQWIGGNRDGDDVMKRMSDEWNNEKDRNPSSLSDPSAPVPPPLFPTEWTVKPATPEDQKVYRDQEAIRYNNPSKAFTYRIHDYEAVVGPVKGCAVINAAINNNFNGPALIPAPVPPPLPSISPNKAREHSLLVNDRPPFVTLLSLVRDAAARLPNGEGTRADICELLKDSQYLLPTVSDQQVNQIVSGALDRLHYEKDPCVKYDTNRKVWIYLHRNRTENDFERLHEMQVVAAKAKRNLSKSRKPSLPKTSPSPTAGGKPNQKSIQRPSPCKSSDSSCSSNTPILPNPSTPIAARIAVSPLAPKPVAIVPQPQNVEKTVLDILTKSSQQAYQLHTSPSNFFVKKNPPINNCLQGPDQMNQVLLKPTENAIRPGNLSMISVSSFAPVNRIITTGSAMAKDKSLTRTTNNYGSQKVGLVTFPGGEHLLNCPRPRAAPLSSVRVTHPISRQVQMPNQTMNHSLTLPPGTQAINIPNSLIMGGRPGHVVLGGKSYMMATTSGGSIVLHPQNCGPIQSGQPSTTSPLTGVGPPLSVRTLQGIKVIPVPTQFNPTGNQRVTPVITTHPVTSQNGSAPVSRQQFVARLISTRPGQLQPNQMIIPNSSYQQVILAPTAQTAQAMMTPKQQIVNQVQVQPGNSFQSQVGALILPQTQQLVNPVKNNTQ